MADLCRILGEIEEAVREPLPTCDLSELIANMPTLEESAAKRLQQVTDSIVPTEAEVERERIIKMLDKMRLWYSAAPPLEWVIERVRKDDLEDFL